MTKLKSPLISLGVRGTLGDKLTFQRRKGLTYARKKPIPADPKSLAQMYQRWDYEDGIFYWQTLTDTQKQAYKTTASRYHMTGFAYFMSWYLKNLPDLVARYHLDEKSGALAYDTSKHAVHAAIDGPSPTRGQIDGAFIFDGLNDKVERAYDTLLDLTDTLTLEVFSRPASLAGVPKGLVTRSVAANKAPYFLGVHVGNFRFFSYDAAVLFSCTYAAPAVDIWYHVAATFDKDLLSDNAKLFVDGILRDKDTYASPLPTNNTSFYMGVYALQWYEGDIDEVSLRNRVLSPAQILRHSQRRYPL